MSDRSGDPSAIPGTPRPAASRAWVDWFEQRINLTELFSFLTHFGLVYTPVDTQQPLREVLRGIARTPIVSYSRWPHVLGLLTALLFGLEAVSGVLLGFYYRSTAAAAYESTRSIVRDVPLGWMIHQVHAWGAYLLVAIVLLRMLRLFWDGLYRAPREILWFSAVSLVWIVLQLDFTGLLLPWDVQSYWAAVRGLEVVSSLPIVGPILAFIMGGHTVTEDVLNRCYIAHIIVLPSIYVFFVYVTFGTMRRVGLSEPDVRIQPPLTTFRRHIVDLMIITLLLFAGLVTLATLLPFHFHGAADPYVTPKGIRPPWYMLAPYTVFQRVPLPAWIPGFVMLAIAFVLPFLPAVVRAGGDRLNPKRMRLAGLAMLGLWLVLSVLGVFVDRK